MTIGNETLGLQDWTSWNYWTPIKDVIGKTVADNVPETWMETVNTIHNLSPVVLLSRYPLTAFGTAGVLVGMLTKKAPLASVGITLVASALVKNETEALIFGLASLVGLLANDSHIQMGFSNLYGRAKATICCRKNPEDEHSSNVQYSPIQNPDNAFAEKQQPNNGKSTYTNPEQGFQPLSKERSGSSSSDGSDDEVSSLW